MEEGWVKKFTGTICKSNVLVRLLLLHALTPSSKAKVGLKDPNPWTFDIHTGY